MQTILITGANRGIGFELVKCFLAAGNRVIAACRKPEHAEALNALANSEELTISQLVVCSGDSVEKLAAQLEGVTIDVLINNAGVYWDSNQTTENMNYDEWSSTFEVNTIAPFRVTAALHSNLKQSNRPRVITISSQMGSLNRVSKGSYAYRSSKAAVNKVMQVMALEFADDGIVVCPVHPGWVKTDMGGDAADITPEQSAAGLYKLIDSLTMEQSGRFWTWDGAEHPW